MASYTMTSLAHQLKEDLAIRLPALTCTETVDASGNAVVTVGALTAGSQSAYIRLIAQPSIRTNSLGSAQESYGPHVIQVVLETSTIASTALLTVANYVKLFGEILRHGRKVDVYMTANTTAVSVSGITGSPTVTFDSLYQPLTATL